MARRSAFLIGNQNFAPDSGLKNLKGPVNDVEALHGVLQDPARGAFTTKIFPDQPREAVVPALEEALNAAGPGDMLLIFYAGHGKLDQRGRLCLAMANTRANALYSTSLPANELRQLIGNSNCEQVVLLLDCCYSGAIGSEFIRGGVEDQLANMVKAHGLFVVTATTSYQTASELLTEEPGVVMGKFTCAIVEGIKTGAADYDGDRRVMLSDLRRYLEETVRGQTPQHWEMEAAGDPFIARVRPAETPTQKRLRRLGAWHADGRLPEEHYLEIAKAVADEGDARSAILVVRRLLDNPRSTAEALIGVWEGTTQPPTSELPDPELPLTVVSPEKDANAEGNFVTYSLAEIIYRELLWKIGHKLKVKCDHTPDQLRWLQLLFDLGLLKTKDTVGWMPFGEIPRGKNLSDIFEPTPAGESLMKLRKAPTMT